VVAPVAELAAQGFPIDRLYADSIAANASLLSQSAYGQKTFFAKGQPLAEGTTLAQPDVAATLSDVASGGAASFYEGTWASEFVAAVAGAGGTASLADLAGYQALLEDPIILQHHAATLFTSSGYSNGGARLLLALQTLDDASAVALGPYDQSPAALELLLRVQAAESSQESWLEDPTALSDPATVNADIVSGAQAMWAMIQAGAIPAPTPAVGTHSSAVVVVDAAGNVVAGTHTIETTNWGLGLFAGGLPLSTSASLHPGSAPGAYVMDPLSSEIAFVGGQPSLAMSTYGTGLHPGDVQVLSYVLDDGLDAEDAVLEPRVGYYAVTTQNGVDSVDLSTHMLDERVPASVVCPVRAAGFGLQQSEPPPVLPGFIDTGFPTVVTIAPTAGPARLAGMTPEWMNGVASGY
jgi:gamma-glutamyltranspeptidase/glutathione hydrolase